MVLCNPFPDTSLMVKKLKLKLKKTLECRNMYCKLKYVFIYLKLLKKFILFFRP